MRKKHSFPIPRIGSFRAALLILLVSHPLFKSLAEAVNPNSHPSRCDADLSLLRHIIPNTADHDVWLLRMMDATKGGAHPEVSYLDDNKIVRTGNLGIANEHLYVFWREGDHYISKWANRARLQPELSTDASKVSARRENIKTATPHLRIQTVEKYPLTQLNYLYEEEHVPSEISGRLGHIPILYFTETERESYRIIIEGGIVYSSSGAPLTHNGTVMFVMDQFGNFYVANEHDIRSFAHSSLLAGSPVAAAGEMRLQNGKIVRINRMSGHYKPAPEALNNALKELESRGIDLNHIEIDQSN